MSSKVDIKVVMLGDRNVGKTSLLGMLLHNEYKISSTHSLAHFGAKKILVEDTPLVLGIWDTGGYDHCDNMNRIYYRSSRAAIVVFDITRETTFSKALFWIGELHDNEENCDIYLVGGMQNLLEEGKERAIPLERIYEFVEKIGADYFEVSSKTGYGVKELFYKIAEDFYFKKYGRNVPKIDHRIESKHSRVILVGPPGSGKSTLIQILENLQDKTFKFPRENVATDGIEVSSIGGHLFWDFGGQETLCATHQFFFANLCQYILVVDLSKLLDADLTISGAAKRSLEIWLNQIRPWTSHRKSPPVIIVGTHCDLVSDFLIWSDKKKTSQLVLELVKSFGIHFTPKVFSMSKNRNFKNSGAKIMEQIRVNIDAQSKGYPDDIPSTLFKKIKTKITEIRRDRPFMWWNEYCKLLDQKQCPERDVKQITNLLVNFGLIVTFQPVSTAASKLVILDPIWLSKAFTSIVSIRIAESSSKLGYFTETQLETNWKLLNIPRETWKDLLGIFETFQMLAILPNGKYYVPAMLHSPQDSPPPVLLSQRIDFVKNCTPYKTKVISRRYEVDGSFPVGFIDRVVVRILHYPGLDIHQTTWEFDYYLVSEHYQVLIRAISTTELGIDIFAAEELAKTSALAFFSHFVFQSPREVLCSYSFPIAIRNTFLRFEEDKEFVSEPLQLQLLFPSTEDSQKDKDMYRNYFGNVPLLDSVSAKYTEKIGENSFSYNWRGEILVNEISMKVNFKEFKSLCLNFETQQQFIQEVITMQRFKSKFAIQLLGICKVSASILNSRNKMGSLEDNIAGNFLIVTERPTIGSLIEHKDELLSKPTFLKVKLALDIARGLQSLHLADGVKFIHRDIKADNISIVSLDESKVSQMDFVHAKIGDFGCVVVASPTYSQRIGNYQYSAPEALNGTFAVPYSTPIDIYSFGILLWELLSGQVPFYELKGKENSVQAVLDGFRPSLDHLPSDTPSKVTDIIISCWSVNPQGRPSFNHIIAQLSSVLLSPCPIVLEGQKDSNPLVNSVERALVLKEKLLGRKISPKYFSNLIYKGAGCDGLVMVACLNLDDVEYEVALKMIVNIHELLKTADHMKKCENEFKILPSILELHPNIVRMLGSFKARPTLEMIDHVQPVIRELCVDQAGNPRTAQFFILEQYNVTLKSLITDNGLSITDICKFSLNLARGLLFLYENKIVHLDIKPDNLMISATGDLVIIDFGHAGRLMEGDLVNIHLTDGGNAAHLAPEVYEAKTLSQNLPCSRQPPWELGMIIYEMCNNGTLPFSNNGSIFCQEQICWDSVPKFLCPLLKLLLTENSCRISIGDACKRLEKIISLHS